MRRMVKEDLLTFEGKPLFPERIAETVPYELTELEQDLYEQVTAYVREGMNRADQARRQAPQHRRLRAHRPAAPAGLQPGGDLPLARAPRRAPRAHASRRSSTATYVAEPRAATSSATSTSSTTTSSTPRSSRNIEEELVDAATAARTVEELDAELLELRDLIEAAERVRDVGTDRKWTELRTILEDNTLATDGERRAAQAHHLHRAPRHARLPRAPDRLAARPARGGQGDPRRRAPRASAGRSPRSSPRTRDCQVLLATDAAGEGLNLQAAHLMVNYDLPWNPNRIEQRFGRIHRIGQNEVCRLWNLVADNTREGEVFTRLLAKIEEQRKAYGGKVFDVLGDGVQRDAAAQPADRRDPLRRAARGQGPRWTQVIDASVAQGHRGAARRAGPGHRARCRRRHRRSCAR